MAQKIITLSIDESVWDRFRKKLATTEGMDRGVISKKVEELIKRYIGII